MSRSHTIRRALVTLILLSAGAYAQGIPFIDGDLTLISPDNDPDLIIARERYDAETRTQSLYLRVYDGQPDGERFSGALSLVGGEIVELIVDGEALAASDARWGIRDDYGPAALRGLERLNREIPPVDDGGDVVALLSPQTLRFFFSTSDDVDDVRLIVRYPDEPGSASFSVRLYGGPHPDPEGWPDTRQGGVQVGSLEQHMAPDDGDYSEVFEVSRLKLWIEDFDVEEIRLEMGAVDPSGGALGPVPFHINNDFGADDADQDNGFDQNGTISPIPSTSALDHLRYEASTLTSGRGDTIPGAWVRLEGTVEALPFGGRAAVDVYVDVLPGQPSGIYRGRVTVWEDNNLDGLADGSEATDAVWLEVVVGDPPNPPIDEGLPPDTGALDAEPPDLGFDASGLDAAPAGDAGDDDASDGATDASMDAGDVGGADVEPSEAGLMDASDAGLDASDSGGNATDARPDASDEGVDASDSGGDVSDSGVDASDGEADAPDGSSDGAPEAGARDGGLEAGVDAAQGEEGGVDRGDEDLGDVRGGACDCQLGHAHPSSGALLLLLLALARRRR